MQKCYIIAMGGTGCRVMKSFIHLCATGAFNDYSFKIICVDADTANGDKAELSALLTKYRDMNQRFRLFPDIETGGDEGFWSPLTGINNSMASSVDSATMGPEARALFNMLYTKEEQDKVLSGGFYGHTSIGAFFMLQSILDGDDYGVVWNKFLGDINVYEDKIFIIGSIFGGTGASGIPTLARIIKSMNSTAEAQIGAMLVMPYFKMEQNENEAGVGSIDWRLFSSKVKSALSFYADQNFNSTFKTMYFLGEDKDNFMYVSDRPEGPEQRNKANHIETLAAASILDFMKESSEAPFCIKMYNEELGSDAEMLDKVAGDGQIYKALTKSLAFSILHTRYFHHAITRHRNNTSKISEGWITRFDIPIEDSKLFFDYFLSFKEWVYEIMVNSKSDGSFASIFGGADNQQGESNAGWFNTGNNFKELYRPDELPHTEKSGFLSKIKTVCYELSKLNCMCDVTKTDTIKLKGGETIINELSTLNFKKSQDNSDMVNLYNLIYQNCDNKRGA